MTDLQRQFVGKRENLEGNHSTCFICAKKLSSQNNQSQKCSNGKCSILPIFRHLNINKVVQVKSNNTQPVDKVPLCDPCNQIFTKVSNYCTEFEVLNLKINYFFNKLKQLIVTEDQLQDQNTDFERARKQLKRKLEENCTSKYRTGPLVVLHRLNVNQLSSISYQTTYVKTNNLSDDEFEPNNDDEITHDQYCSSDMDYESDTSHKSKSLQRASKKPHCKSSLLDTAKRPAHNKNVHCSECNYKCRHKYELLEHSSLYHPEKHFPSKSKPDYLTQLQHRLYLTHLLNTEIDSCGSFKSGGYNCAYCPKIFGVQRRRLFRRHLTKFHQDKLLKNLVQLQHDVSTEQLSKIVKMPVTSVQKRENLGREKNLKLKQFCKSKKRMKHEFSCSICQVRTTSLRNHEAIHHPEKFLKSKRSDQVSTEQFKLYCVYLINKQVENFTKSRQDRKVRYHCIHCQNSYVDLQGCRNHLVLAHADLLSVEIEKLQQNIKPDDLNVTRTIKRCTKEFVRPIKNPVQINSTSCKFCDIRLTQRGIAIHMRKNHPKEYVKTYRCEVCVVCKNTFRSKWWLDFHRTSVHVDQILGNFKAKNVSVEQFKGYCKLMVDTELGEVGQVGKTDEVVRYKCTHCSTTFSDMKYAQIHLVLKHKELLGNKLIELQENKSVVEVEQGVVTKREEFDEELVEDDDFEATDVFCVKNALKQEASESCDKDIGEMEDLDETLNESGMYQQDIEIKQEECKMDVEAILPNKMCL